MIKIKYKVPVIIFIAILLMSIISAYVDYSNNLELIHNAKEDELQKVGTFILNEVTRQGKKAIADASLIGHQPWVEETVGNGERELLAKNLVPGFKVQQTEFGVKEATFFTPPAVVFLRLFDVGNFGENLTFRNMILAANLQKKAQRGVEIGRYGVGMRGIVNLKVKDAYVGAFEVTFDFPTIAENIKKNLGFDVGIFVEEERMSKIATKVEKPSSEKIIAGYRLVETTDWPMIKKVATPQLLSTTNDVVYRILTIDGVDYGFTNVPLLNFEGIQIGSVLAVRKFSNFQGILQYSVIEGTVLSFLQAVVVAGLAFAIFYYLLIAPMAKLNAKLSQLADGDTKIDLGSFLKRQDEIGVLAKGIEKVQSYLSSLKSKETEEKKATESSVKPKKSRWPRIFLFVLMCGYFCAHTSEIYGEKAEQVQEKLQEDKNHRDVINFEKVASKGAQPISESINVTTTPITNSNHLTMPWNFEKPLKVGVTYIVNAISKITEIAGTYEANIDLQLSWHDPNMTFNPVEIGSGRIVFSMEAATEKLGGMWNPHVFIANMTEKPILVQPSLMIYADGTIVYIQRIKAVFDTKYNLVAFPFDTQYLSLKLVSSLYSSEQLIFYQNQEQLDHSGLREGILLGGWNFRDVEYNITDIRGLNGNYFSQFEARVVISRKPVSHLFYLAPLLLVVIVPTILTFYSKTDVSGRLANWAGSMLALIALSFTLNLRYPALPADGILAQIVSIVFGYQFLMICLSTTVFDPELRKKVKNPFLIPEIIDFLRWGIPCAFVIIILARILLTAYEI